MVNLRAQLQGLMNVQTMIYSTQVAKNTSELCRKNVHLSFKLRPDFTIKCSLTAITLQATLLIFYPAAAQSELLAVLL